MSKKLIIASAIACGGLLLFTAVATTGDSSIRTFLPKEGEIVAIRSAHAGKYLEVSPHDGRLRATATRPVNHTALFRIMILPNSMVELLIDASRTANSAQWAQRRHWTGGDGPGSGCQCSGYSNDHGFGAYCYGWEYEMQAPWCYVTEACSATDTFVKGSFGRKYADCVPLKDGYQEDASEYHTRFNESFDEDGAPIDWGNVSRAWDETGNFTGMDEYWRGTRAYEEGEEDPWWFRNDQGDEGEQFPEYDFFDEEGNFSGCNCPAYCVSNGWIYQGGLDPFELDKVAELDASDANVSDANVSDANASAPSSAPNLAPRNASTAAAPTAAPAVAASCPRMSRSFAS